MALYEVFSVNTLSMVTATSSLHLQPSDKVVDLMHISSYAYAQIKRVDNRRSLYILRLHRVQRVSSQ